MSPYRAYGLAIESEFELPELETCRAEPDVLIRLGSVSDSPDEPVEDGHLYRVSSGHYVSFENIGTLLVSDGRSIVLEPADDAVPEALRQFVLGRGFRLLLHQRGYVVLHASTAIIDGEAVAFLGESGQGKSTTAAGFYGEGYPVLADDVTPVEPETAEVLPGFQQVKLDREAAASVGTDLDSTNASNFSRRYYRVPSEFDGDPVPLGCIYLLSDGPEIRIESVPPSGRPYHLMRSSASAYRSIDDDAVEADLEDCVRLSSKVPVKRLERPRSFESLPDLVTAVETDLAETRERGTETGERRPRNCEGGTEPGEGEPEVRDGGRPE